MVASVSGTLDSNVDKANGIGMALTTEKQITLIVSGKSGGNNNHHIGLEISGGNTSDGDFLDVLESAVVGIGIKTINHNAGYVKAKVFRPEGDISEVNVKILAR